MTDSDSAVLVQFQMSQLKHGRGRFFVSTFQLTCFLDYSIISKVQKAVWIRCVKRKIMHFRGRECAWPKIVFGTILLKNIRNADKLTTPQFSFCTLVWVWDSFVSSWFQSSEESIFLSFWDAFTFYGPDTGCLKLTSVIIE